MKCMACKNKMHNFFTKTFNRFGIGEAIYVKCKSCGFVASQTHSELSESAWDRLNKEFHDAYHGTDSSPYDSRWIARLNAQAETIADLSKLGLIPQDMPWVDYGCGDGKLSDILQATYGLSLLKFDHVTNTPPYLSQAALKKNHFGLVITTSVFEHLRNRQELDEIVSLVASNGIMGLHTLVAEEIPCDSSWFYLLAAHCAFFSNKSMQIICEQLGFSSSIYHVNSQLWFMFKSDPDRIEEIVANANDRPGQKKFHYHFKRGFMDYWKLGPEEVAIRQSDPLL